MEDFMQPNEWMAPPVQAVSAPAPRRRGVVVGAGLLGAGVIAGAIIGSTVLSGAATTPSPTAPPAAGSAGAPFGHGPGRGLALSGTVTAVGSSSVTIKTASGTTTYKVDATSDIDKNGEAKLSALKVGDAVRFSVTGANVIDKLHAGDEALDRPPGFGQGFGHGPGRMLPLSGTVTAVGSSSVTIKTASGSTTYKVDATSDIDKNGEAKLSSLKVGDAVRFSVTGANVIDKLHAGDEALNRPPCGPGPDDDSDG
jgi:preprotein translocase subunit YajC